MHNLMLTEVFKGGANATITFNSNSTYQHAVPAATIPSATWAPSATCKLYLVQLTQCQATSYNPLATLPERSSTECHNISFNGNLTTVNGNFRVSGTNSQELRLTGNTNLTMNLEVTLSLKTAAGWLSQTVIMLPLLLIGGNFYKTVEFSTSLLEPA